MFINLSFVDINIETPVYNNKKDFEALLEFLNKDSKYSGFEVDLKLVKILNNDVENAFSFMLRRLWKKYMEDQTTCVISFFFS